jgi:hypothetical protein
VLARGVDHRFYRGGNLRDRRRHQQAASFLITQPRIKTWPICAGQLRGPGGEGRTTAIVKDIAKAAGLGPDDYKLSIVGGSPTRWRLLKEGKIDAGLQPIPNSYEAEDAGFSNLGAALNCSRLAVHQRQCRSLPSEKNRSLVVKFLRAPARSDFMNTNRARLPRSAPRNCARPLP